MATPEYEKRGWLHEDFRLFHLRDAELGDIGYHYHEFHKIILFLSGSAAYVVEGRRYILQPGDVVLVGRGCVHRPEAGADAPYERIILYISPEFLQKNSSPECSLESCFANASQSGSHVLRGGSLSGLFTELEREFTGEAFGSAICASALLIRLVIELTRGMESRSLTFVPTDLCDDKIVAILSYINNNISSDISIDSLAERFYISKFHMMRRFRAETGFSIYNYIIDKRLLLAHDLIQSGMSATDACFRCGYRSYSSFSRAYRRMFSASPGGRSGVEDSPEEENA